MKMIFFNIQRSVRFLPRVNDVFCFNKIRISDYSFSTGTNIRTFCIFIYHF